MTAVNTTLMISLLWETHSLGKQKGIHIKSLKRRRWEKQSIIGSYLRPYTISRTQKSDKKSAKRQPPIFAAIRSASIISVANQVFLSFIFISLMAIEAVYTWRSLELKLIIATISHDSRCVVSSSIGMHHWSSMFTHVANNYTNVGGILVNYKAA